MDALGHVNNTVYFRWFESARIACFDKLGLWAIGEETGIGPILASASCRFRIPVTYPDTVGVGTRIRDVLEDRFTMDYRAVSLRHEAIAAEGEGLIVAYDYRHKHKALIPPDMRERIHALFQAG
jgi:acyl-CoA thioester hydrolase